MDKIYCVLCSAENVIRQVCVQKRHRPLCTADMVSNKQLGDGRTLPQQCCNEKVIALFEQVHFKRWTWWWNENSRYS